MRNIIADRFFSVKNYPVNVLLHFNNKLLQVTYNPDRFKLMIGEDRYLFGVVSAGDDEAPFSRLMQYKTLYDTLIDLDWKVKLSFEMAIKYAYSERNRGRTNGILLY